MKKVLIFLVLIVSLSVEAQIPKDSIVMNSQVFQAENWHSRCYQIFNANFGSDNDALMWQYNYIDNQSRLAIYKTSQYGFSVFPWNFFTISGEISGVDILKTDDSVSSIQAVYADTLLTLRSNSFTPTFSIFKEKLNYQPVMVRNGEINSQLAGDETLIVDSTWKEIYVYHFNGVTSDFLQTLSITDSIICLEFGDFNGDSLNDLAVVYQFFTNDSLIQNYSAAKFFVQSVNGLVFWKEIHLNKKACSARAADLQGDGFYDLLISSADSSAFGLLVVNFTDSVSLPTFDSYDSYQLGDFTVGDLNRDNYLDIIGRRSDTSLLVVYRNDQNGAFVCDGLFSSRGVQPPIYHSTVLLELGLDNRPDVVYVSDESLFSNQNITPYYSDLKLSSVEWPVSFQLGNNYQDTIKVKISNIGEAIASGDSLSARTTIYLKSLSDSLLAEKIINQVFDSLFVGDSITLDFVLDSIDISNCSKLEIVVEINPNQCLSELTLKNNSQKNEWEFSFPDLIISEITFDTTGGTLSQDNVIVELRNIGCQAVDTAKIDFAAFLKRGDSVYFSTEYRLSIPDLTAGRIMDVFLYLGEISDSLNFLANDSLIVSVFVDQDSVISEADETNNEKTLRLRLGDFLSLDLSRNSAEFNFQLYPNPTSGIINLILPRTGETVEIFNNLGQEIWSQKVNQQTEIDLSGHPAGIYVLKINNLSKKIIKNK